MEDRNFGASSQFCCHNILVLALASRDLVSARLIANARRITGCH
jgi:hypothetical protein